MTHLKKLHLEAIPDIFASVSVSPIKTAIGLELAASKSAEITEQIAIEFAIFFKGWMPMNCKEIMRNQDLSSEEKVKLVFQEFLKSKKNDRIQPQCTPKSGIPNRDFGEDEKTN